MIVIAIILYSWCCRPDKPQKLMLCTSDLLLTLKQLESLYLARKISVKGTEAVWCYETVLTSWYFNDFFLLISCPTSFALWQEMATNQPSFLYLGRRKISVKFVVCHKLDDKISSTDDDACTFVQKGCEHYMCMVDWKCRKGVLVDGIHWVAALMIGGGLTERSHPKTSCSCFLVIGTQKYSLLIHLKQERNDVYSPRASLLQEDKVVFASIL